MKKRIVFSRNQGDLASLSRPPPPFLFPHPQALLRDTPLIPVELLYGQPLVTDPQLSPDGAWLSFLAPSPPNNTLNVFVVPLRNTSSTPPPPNSPAPKALQLTKETSFDVEPGAYQWSPDSRFVLYLFDRDPKVGDRYRLWRKEVAKPSEEAVDLLPELSTGRRKMSNDSSDSGDEPLLPPSNRTLPPGLMGDNLHIGQFFLSEKVPVSREEEFPLSFFPLSSSSFSLFSFFSSVAVTEESRRGKRN